MAKDILNLNSEEIDQIKKKVAGYRKQGSFSDPETAKDAAKAELTWSQVRTILSSEERELPKEPDNS